MDANRKNELLTKYQQGKIGKEELKELFYWYNQQASQDASINENEMEFRLNRIAERLPAGNGQIKTHASIQKIWLKWAAAAILIGAIGLSIWKLSPTELTNNQTLTEIHPNKDAQPIWINKDGQRIEIGNLGAKDTLKTSGLIVFKNAEGFLTYQSVTNEKTTQEIQTIQTPAGSNIKLILTDGTKIWLNAASKLRFFSDMTKGDRQVELEGEAYFEVTKHQDEQNQPRHFRIRSDQQVVEVLGTKFNIKNHKNDPSATTSLYEGSIRLETDHNNYKSVLLKPGQQSILDKNSHQLDFKNLQDLDHQPWTEGYFNFDGDAIQQVCQQLARWYPVTFEIDPAVPSGEYHGSISKSYSLNEVLNILTQNKLNVEIKNKNDQIIVRLKQK